MWTSVSPWPQGMAVGGWVGPGPPGMPGATQRGITPPGTVPSGISTPGMGPPGTSPHGMSPSRASPLGVEAERGASGRGGIENRHSTDVKPPPPPPRVCMWIHAGKS